MQNRFIASLIVVAIAAAVVTAVVTVRLTQPGRAAAATAARTVDGKPDFSGIWQVLNEAHWDLQAHEARPGAVTQRGVYPFDYVQVPAAPVLALGAAGGVPGSVGVVEGDGQIPYTPEAAAIKEENAEHWIDRAGNFHSDALHLVERFTPITRDAIHCEVTIEDPKVFTRPWKISMPLYRRLEPNAQLLEYRCMEFVEEFLWGNLRKQQLVKRWEGETIIVDITRKVPPADKLHDWYRR